MNTRVSIVNKYINWFKFPLIIRKFHLKKTDYLFEMLNLRFILLLNNTMHVNLRMLLIDHLIFLHSLNYYNFFHHETKVYIYPQFINSI